MRLGITGLGGFIGQRVAELAREHGWTVRGIELSPTRCAALRNAGYEVECGDILDASALDRAFAGCDAVLHTAAIVREGGRLADFRRINVDGATLAAERAAQAGAKTFVHLSSVMVYGFRFPSGIDEDGPKDGAGNPYCITKIEAEKALLEFAARPGAPRIVLVRPGDVYGPGSEPWVLRPLELLRRGIFALPGDGQGVINHVYIDNLVDAIFLAIEKAPAGAAFNVTDGARTTWLEFYTRLAALVGLPAPRRLPTAAMKAGIWALASVQRLFGREPAALPGGVDYVSRRGVYSIERARATLGYVPRITLDEGLQRSARWFRATQPPEA